MSNETEQYAPHWVEAFLAIPIDVRVRYAPGISRAHRDGYLARCKQEDAKIAALEARIAELEAKQQALVRLADCPSAKPRITP